MSKDDAVSRALKAEQGVEAATVATASIDGTDTEVVLVEAAPYVSLIELRVRAVATGLFGTPPAILSSRKLPLPIASGTSLADLIKTARARDDLLLFTSPSTQPEAKLVAYVEELLSLQPIGVLDDFFQIGVDSLAAIKLAMFVDETWPGRVEGDDVLTCGTIRALAKTVR